MIKSPIHFIHSCDKKITDVAASGCGCDAQFGRRRTCNPPTRYVHQSLSQTCSYLPKGSFQSMSELVWIITVKTAPFQEDGSVKQNTRALKINHLNWKPSVLQCPPVLELKLSQNVCYDYKPLCLPTKGVNHRCITPITDGVTRGFSGERFHCGTFIVSLNNNHDFSLFYDFAALSL